MKLFLFDFDGVIVDSLDVYEKTVTDCSERHKSAVDTRPGRISGALRR